MKGVFLGENHILDNLSMPLASAQQTQTRIRSRTDVFGRQLKKNGWLKKKKEKVPTKIKILEGLASSGGGFSRQDALFRFRV